MAIQSGGMRRESLEDVVVKKLAGGGIDLMYGILGTAGEVTLKSLLGPEGAWGEGLMSEGALTARKAKTDREMRLAQIKEATDAANLEIAKFKAETGERRLSAKESETKSRLELAEETQTQTSLMRKAQIQQMGDKKKQAAAKQAFEEEKFEEDKKVHRSQAAERSARIKKLNADMKAAKREEDRLIAKGTLTEQEKKVKRSFTLFNNKSKAYTAHMKISGVKGDDYFDTANELRADLIAAIVNSHEASGAGSVSVGGVEYHIAVARHHAARFRRLIEQGKTREARAMFREYTDLGPSISAEAPAPAAAVE